MDWRGDDISVPTSVMNELKVARSRNKNLTHEKHKMHRSIPHQLLIERLEYGSG